MEIGCGPGALLSELAARHSDAGFVGLDIAPNMIEHARERHSRENVRYELLDLGESRTGIVADFAYSIDVLHHVHELPRFLEGVRSLLRSGAMWLAIEPNAFHPYIFWSQERLRRAGFDEDHFRPRRFEPRVKDAGFAVRDRRYAFFFPGWIDRVPAAIAWVEPALERFRLLGGSVVYLLERQ